MFFGICRSIMLLWSFFGMISNGKQMYYSYLILVPHCFIYQRYFLLIFLLYVIVLYRDFYEISGFSSPLLPDQLWGPLSLLSNGYWGLSTGGKADRV
jgi:hypothetical protein